MAEETDQTNQTGAGGGGYQVLARKYRSRGFDEVVGQRHVSQTLRRAIETGRIHHAYLFCGTRGVGKTSMARILAVALNDPSGDGPNPDPDPTSHFARSVFKGEDVDVVEIDAASNTGVDNVRDLIENARFRPMRSRFKVYIIDEVHMLSKAAFNALLKIMEEPPSHVKFILATTEPEKVLPTILSRVQRFDFRNIESAEIVAHLREVTAAEGKGADEAALKMVARGAAGSMRDALSLLDRLLSASDGGLTADTVTTLLGLPPAEKISRLVEAVGAGDVAAALKGAAEVLDSGQSSDVLVAGLVEHFHALLVLKAVGSGAGELASLPGVADEILEAQAGSMSAADLSQNVVILEELRRNLRTGAAGRALLDATLVRLALSEQFTPIDVLLEGGGPAESPSRGLSPKKASHPAADPVGGATATGTVTGDNVEAVGVGEGLEALWSRLRRGLSQSHATLAPLLDGGRISRLEVTEGGGDVEVVYPADRAIFVSMLGRNGKKELLAEAIAGAMGWPNLPQVVLKVSEQVAAEPAGPAAAPRGREVVPEAGPEDARVQQTGPTGTESLRVTDFDFSGDPFISVAVRDLGARVLKVEQVGDDADA